MNSSSFVSFFKSVIQSKISEWESNVLGGLAQDYPKAIGVISALKSVFDGIDAVHANFINTTNPNLNSSTTFSNAPVDSSIATIPVDVTPVKTDVSSTSN
jgi:hypothetical protein